MTAHSTSTPALNASTMTRPSWVKAPSSAATSSSSWRTLAMPTEEPSRAGLTNSGRPSAASSSRTAPGASRQRASRMAT